MARRPRLLVRNAVYHVTSRGNRQSFVFETEADHHSFMLTLDVTVEAYGARVYAVCLMGTHYHLVVDTPRHNLSAMMRQLNGDFAQHWNRRHGQTGHTFQERFDASVVQREGYLRRVVRYVARNPVKARLVADAASWRWSTHRAIAGLEPAPPWLYVDWIDRAFKTESRSDAQRRYRAYVNSQTGWDVCYDDSPLIIGTKQYQKSVIAALGDAGNDHRLTRKCRHPTRPRLAVLFRGLGANRSRRDAAILTAHETHGYTLSEIARVLAIDPTTASKARRRAREARRLRR